MNKVGQMGRLFVSAGLLSFLAISVAQAKTVFPGHLVADEASNLAAKASDGSMTVFSRDQNGRGMESASLSTSADVNQAADRSAFEPRPQGIVIGTAALRPTPEPGTIVLMIGGLAVIGWTVRKRARA